MILRMFVASAVASFYSFLPLIIIGASLVTAITLLSISAPSSSSTTSPTLQPTLATLAPTTTLAPSTSFPTTTFAPTATSSPTTFAPSTLSPSTDSLSESPTSQPTLPLRPNVIFMLADDLGINSVDTPQGRALGLYDGRAQSIKTPQLSRLASMGVFVERHLADSPVCSPSRYAFLTGIPTGSKWSRVRGNTGLSDVEGAEQDHTLFAAGELSLPKELQRVGYATAAFGKHHMRDAGHTLGFNYSLTMSTFPDAEYPRFFPEVLLEDLGTQEVETRAYTPKNNALGIKTYNQETSKCNLQGSTKCEFAPQIYQAKMLEWIGAQLDAQIPFFVYMGFLEPHDGKFLTSEGTNGLPVPSIAGPIEDYSTSNPDYSSYFPRLRQYASSITNYMDVHVGEIIDFLQERNALNNTLLIFTSDNGAADAISAGSSQTNTMFESASGPRLNKPYRSKKRNLLFGGVGIPTIVVYPNEFPAGATLRNQYTVNSDFTKTILAVAGVQLHEQFTGINLFDALKSAEGIEAGSELLAREYIYNEICLNDRGVLGRHTNCDFSVIFTRANAEPCFRYKIIYAATNDIDLVINEFGAGFLSTRGSPQGNLTRGILENSGYIPYAFNGTDISEAQSQSAPARITDFVRSCIDKAEDIILQHRIVPTGEEIAAKLAFQSSRYFQ